MTNSTKATIPSAPATLVSQPVRGARPRTAMRPSATITNPAVVRNVDVLVENVVWMKARQLRSMPGAPFTQSRSAPTISMPAPPSVNESHERAGPRARGRHGHGGLRRGIFAHVLRHGDALPSMQAAAGVIPRCRGLDQAAGGRVEGQAQRLPLESKCHDPGQGAGGAPDRAAPAIPR